MMVRKFYFSVIRLVPDPVKDEPINLGVAVIDEGGTQGDLLYNPRIKTRIGVVKSGFPIESFIASIEDLRFYLQLQSQERLAESRPHMPRGGRERLESAAEYLDNQLQITEPRLYRADDLEQAVRGLYGRYVARRLPGQGHRPELTAAEMRTRIWNVVSEWRQKNVVVERGGWLRSAQTRARHPADFVIKNGTPRAALFALPASDVDKVITYLYRDSLPTIASDMGGGFEAIGVLPDEDQTTSSSAQEFISETRALLSGYPGVRPVSLSELPGLEERLLRRLI